MTQNPIQHTQVIVRESPKNGLGTAGFITAIASWFTCGLLMPIALIISLLGLLKAPRGMAIAGVIVSGLAAIPLVLALGFFGLIGGSVAMFQADFVQEKLASQAIAAMHAEAGALPSVEEGNLAIEGIGFDASYKPISPTLFELRLHPDDPEKERLSEWTFENESWVQKTTAPSAEKPEKNEPPTEVTQPLKESSTISVARAKIVGFWKSQKTSDLDGQYIYTAYAVKEFLDVFEWVPYKVVQETDNKLLYQWDQDTGSFKIQRKTTVEFLPEDRIRIKFDSFSDGIIYKRITKSRWDSEVEKIDADALDRLRGSLQRLADELAPSI